MKNVAKLFFRTSTCRLFYPGLGFALLLTVVVGCGDNHRLSGKVTFKDGQPAPCGMVLFTTPTFQAKGEIKSDGSFVVGSQSSTDGLPKGEYKVSVSGITKPVKGMGGMASYIPLCDEKYQSETTSGLTCTVPAPGNRFDLVLDPHPKNYP